MLCGGLGWGPFRDSAFRALLAATTVVSELPQIQFSMLKLGLGGAVCVLHVLPGWVAGGCGPRSGCLGLMAFGWICWEQRFEVRAVEQSVKGEPLARSFVRLLFFQRQRNKIVLLQFI